MDKRKLTADDVYQRVFRYTDAIDDILLEHRPLFKTSEWNELLRNIVKSAESMMEEGD